MKSPLAFVTITLCATTGIGCYSTWDIAPASVVNLDGMREGQPRLAQTPDGDKIEIANDTRLSFQRIDNAQVAGTFRSIDVRASQLLAVDSQRGGVVVVDIPQLKAVQARKFSVGKTVGLSVGLGLGVPGVLAGIGVIILASTGGFGSGRPLRLAAGASPTRAPLLRHRAECTSRRSPRGARGRSVEEATRNRLFAHWANEASAEGASIPAFLALARDLKLAAAPDAVVEQALRAAREEALHTALCTELANVYTDAPIAAWIPGVPRNTDRDPAALLERLAVEAFTDGCLAEGTAAAVARRSAVVAKDEKVSRALLQIARDEQGHADLASQIVGFCLSRGGRAIRDALGARVERMREEQEAAMTPGAEGQSDGIAGFDEDFARSGGVPTGNLLRAAQAEVWEKSAGRLARI